MYGFVAAGLKIVIKLSFYYMEWSISKENFEVKLQG